MRSWPLALPSCRRCASGVGTIPGPGRNPMLAVLYAGYLWLILGLALDVLAGLGWLPPFPALHALTTGAFGVFTLGMMTRVTLGHTGREVRGDALTSLAFVLINAAALARVLPPLSRRVPTGPGCPSPGPCGCWPSRSFCGSMRPCCCVRGSTAGRGSRWAARRALGRGAMPLCCDDSVPGHCWLVGDLIQYRCGGLRV